MNRLLHGDCLAVLKTIPDNSIDSVVTDPPYGLDNVGDKWHDVVPMVPVWQECLRVLKPGGIALVFSAARTQHHMAMNLENAGFEIRDQLVWSYLSGYPKSLDVSAALDKLEGCERPVIGEKESIDPFNKSKKKITKKYSSDPISELAKKYDGWGTGLRPANEPITVARKPIPDKYNVAECIKEFGTGAINLVDSRIARAKDSRWPSNIMMDGGVADWIEIMHSESSETYLVVNPDRIDHNPKLIVVPKPAGKERALSDHPTRKPVKLMEYLVRLVTPPGGMVLDPFAGSGSTGVAAVRQGMSVTLIELSDEFYKTIVDRFENIQREMEDIPQEEQSALDALFT